MIDHSGSMGEVCSAEQPRLTKHRAIVDGLAEHRAFAGSTDAIDLWEFDDARQPRRSRARRTKPHRARPAAEPVPPAARRSGSALAGVTAQSKARDVLLVTDGKSHALDVQDLARTGRRFAVVLVGEDSLEANVGHLAALSGGDIFVAAGAELADVLEAALRSLRSDHAATTPITGKPQHVMVRRAGMTFTADWRQPAAPGEETVESRAVAALAASLVLPALDAEAAAALAESEGLVTHLTSLVLVDEAGAAQDGLPGARKVLLPDPRTSVMARAMPRASAMAGAASLQACYDSLVPSSPPPRFKELLRGLASPAPSGRDPSSQKAAPPRSTGGLTSPA